MGVRFGPGLFERRPTVCVCVDSSVASRQAAQWAASFLRHEGQTMKLFTVVQPSTSSQLLSSIAGALPTDAECEPDPRDLERAQALLQERRHDVEEVGVAAGRVDTSTVVSCLGTAQDIGNKLLAEAERCKCQMLIVGSRGLGEAGRVMLTPLGMGSVSTHMVTTGRLECMAVFRPAGSATADSLTVKPEGYPCKNT